MKKVSAKLAAVASSSLAILASFFVGTASAFAIHQPKPPDELLKK
ncbi:AgrD family cyclic lactone autoinducer peptide [Brevibacillus borstelensis]